MNVEVAVVGEKREEKKDESCMDSGVVDLGKVSEETMGSYGGFFHDGGVMRYM